MALVKFETKFSYAKQITVKTTSNKAREQYLWQILVQFRLHREYQNTNSRASCRILYIMMFQELLIRLNRGEIFSNVTLYMASFSKETAFTECPRSHATQSWVTCSLHMSDYNYILKLQLHNYNICWKCLHPVQAKLNIFQHSRTNSAKSGTVQFRSLFGTAAWRKLTSRVCLTAPNDCVSKKYSAINKFSTAANGITIVTRKN